MADKLTIQWTGEDYISIKHLIFFYSEAFLLCWYIVFSIYFERHVLFELICFILYLFRALAILKHFRSSWENKNTTCFTEKENHVFLSPYRWIQNVYMS